LFFPFLFSLIYDPHILFEQINNEQKIFCRCDTTISSFYQNGWLRWYTNRTDNRDTHLRSRYSITINKRTATILFCRSQHLFGRTSNGWFVSHLDMLRQRLLSPAISRLALDLSPTAMYISPTLLLYAYVSCSDIYLYLHWWTSRFCRLLSVIE